MKNPNLTKALTVLKYLAIYYLSAKMICFAIPKFLFMQFRVLNWQSYVPLVELSKYQHMWSFFGRSYNYNLFIGITEFLIGVLIVFKRTRLIALLLALGLCINILILNIEFDIYFATSHVAEDLILTVLLLTGYHKDLYTFFIRFGGKFNDSMGITKGKFARFFPYGFVIVLSISYFIFSLYIKSKYTADEDIVGAYKIKKMKINDSIINLGKGKLTNDPMMFFEYNSQFVLSIEDTLYKGRFIVNDDRIRIYLDYPTGFKMKSMIGSIKNDNSIIIGKVDEKRPFEIIYERIDGSKNYLNELYR